MEKKKEKKITKSKLKEQKNNRIKRENGKWNEEANAMK